MTNFSKVTKFFPDFFFPDKVYIKGHKPELKIDILGQLKNKQENKAQKKLKELIGSNKIEDICVRKCISR